jgi:hypothetical protein
VLKRCEIFCEGGGFVFDSIHNVQAGTPFENMVAMIDAVREFNGGLERRARTKRLIWSRRHSERPPNQVRRKAIQPPPLPCDLVDCFVASLLAMTAHSDRIGSPPAGPSRLALCCRSAERVR